MPRRHWPAPAAPSVAHRQANRKRRSTERLSRSPPWPALEAFRLISLAGHCITSPAISATMTRTGRGAPSSSSKRSTALSMLGCNARGKRAMDERFWDEAEAGALRRQYRAEQEAAKPNGGDPGISEVHDAGDIDVTK